MFLNVAPVTSASPDNPDHPKCGSQASQKAFDSRPSGTGDRHTKMVTHCVGVQAGVPSRVHLLYTGATQWPKMGLVRPQCHTASKHLISSPWGVVCRFPRLQRDLSRRVPGSAAPGASCSLPPSSSLLPKRPPQGQPSSRYSWP